MDIATARATVLKLGSFVGLNGRRFFAKIEGDRIVFFGSSTGSHSLDYGCSSEERIQAHWTGYTSDDRPASPPELIGRSDNLTVCECGEELCFDWTTAALGGYVSACRACAPRLLAEAVRS